MKQKEKNASPVILPGETLEIEEFAKFMTEAAAGSTGLEAEFFHSSIEKFKSLLQAGGGKTSVFSADILRFITEFLCFSAGTGSKKGFLAMPVSGHLIFGKKELDAWTSQEKEQNIFFDIWNEQADRHDSAEKFAYSAIWEKYIGISTRLIPQFILPATDMQSGRHNFLEASFDYRFLKISSEMESDNIIRELNAIDNDFISLEDSISRLRNSLPLNRFSFRGFRFISLTDVTIAHIGKITANRILESRNIWEDPAIIEEVTRGLKIIAGSDELEFSLMTMLKLNDRFTFNAPVEITGTNHHSDSKALRHQLFDFLANIYRLDPRRIFLEEISTELIEKYSYLKVLKDSGVCAYGILPIFFQAELVGVIEVYSRKRLLLDKKVLSRIDPAIPVIALLFRKSIDSFNQQIEGVIREKFTYLQPSVLWRFNEASWNYLANAEKGTGQQKMEDIYFRNVYPIYGAIDIRNSTINRNHALKKDLVLQISHLVEIIGQLQQATEFGLLAEKANLCGFWQDVLLSQEMVQENEVNYFLESTYALLNDFMDGKEPIPIMETYRSALDPQTGIFSKNRRNLETAMNALISTVNIEVEQIGIRAQTHYPCFFDKFQTDGVEYDIYLGQSMAPEKPFKMLYIENLRLLQLSSMIGIAKKSKELQLSMEVKVESTQLIFVHSHFIDIKFRNDERRFDVEGAYNIRYQVVKKRIDKVLIRDTGERLTMPGKIAMVYFNQRDADEFTTHIKFLQKRGDLEEQIEFLELEPLQGITGLRAMRVTVKE